MTTPNDTAPERIDGAELLNDVAATITRYVILPSPAALIAVVLWIAATHAVPAWNCAARLVIRAPQRRCGKSRLLDMVEAMCHQPMMTANASPSAVYRSIGLTPSDPPTLLIDEADTIFGPKAGDNEDLRGLLNAGHQRGRPTKRYNAGRDRVESHETFAMAALAGIGAMPDTIEDRAAVIRMRRRAAGETVQPYRVRRDAPALAVVRNRLHEWLTAHLDELTDAMPTMPLEDRAADTWEPLIAVADLAGDHWPADARQAALTLLADQEDSAELPLSVRLLADCRSAFRDADALPTADLLQRLLADEEAPWATLGSGGLSPMKLGMLLRDFEIRSGNIRFPTGQAKGYHRSAFTDAWNRYCPEPETTTDDTGTAQAVPAVPAVPMQVAPGTASTPGTAQAVPPTQAVPHLTSEGTPGTAGTAWALRAVPDLADDNNRTDCA
ncbi:uncharacterized protein DUF3631 [Kribbella sp. VKM Ac-2569]|uniref:DUF3631 domain-containing protein n=1 Tax=Kribbella sp. VKM Ac-2569 TaxID=2512220 RepID=UPI00102AAD0C|nr:DUF3631 domain-containing protein [Kribbella sp. VKM Ac-2569]RZT15214.1 uncharacterized protein DUF3631 [Kribbella sp. VKM Ac-2569]